MNDKQPTIQGERHTRLCVLNLENIKKPPLTLSNMHRYLEKAFEYIDIVSGGQAVIALGNTGCGKSTMLTSLMYGKESLEFKTCTKLVDLPGGGQKEKKFKAIDTVDG